MRSVQVAVGLLLESPPAPHQPSYPQLPAQLKACSVMQTPPQLAMSMTVIETASDPELRPLEAEVIRLVKRLARLPFVRWRPFAAHVPPSDPKDLQMRAHISTKPDSGKRHGDPDDDLEPVPERVKDLLETVQSRRQQILDFLHKPFNEALREGSEYMNEDVRVTDIRSANHQPLEKKFRKVLAARSLGREYSLYKRLPSDRPAKKSSFCNSVGQKSGYRQYILQGEKLLQYEENANAGVAIIFAFVWKKGICLKAKKEIPKFTELLRKREPDLYESLNQCREWLEVCQQHYDSKPTSKTFL